MTPDVGMPGGAAIDAPRSSVATALESRPAAPSIPGNARILATAVATGLVVFVGAGQIERWIIAAAGAHDNELRWISDVVAAVAVTTVTYLWLHLRASRTQIHQLERTRIVLDEQLRLAAEIQQALLPACPTDAPNVRWAARMEAALRVGGDFYDFATTGDGDVLVVLGDVSGKGLPAALLQSSLQTLFRTHATMGRDPAEIAARMSEGLRRQTGGTPYATAIVAWVQPRVGKITYVNAGHPPGLVLRASEVVGLTVGGPPLGLLPDVAYDRGTLALLAGDLVLLVTDGITEALDMRWRDVLRGLAPEVTPADAAQLLLQASRAASGPSGAGPEWQDDRTVVAFRVLADSAPPCPARA